MEVTSTQIFKNKKARYYRADLQYGAIDPRLSYRNKTLSFYISFAQDVSIEDASLLLKNLIKDYLTSFFTSEVRVKRFTLTLINQAVVPKETTEPRFVFSVDASIGAGAVEGTTLYDCYIPIEFRGTTKTSANYQNVYHYAAELFQAPTKESSGDYAEIMKRISTYLELYLLPKSLGTFASPALKGSYDNSKVTFSLVRQREDLASNPNLYTVCLGDPRRSSSKKKK